MTVSIYTRSDYNKVSYNKCTNMTPVGRSVKVSRRFRVDHSNLSLSYHTQYMSNPHCIRRCLLLERSRRTSTYLWFVVVCSCLRVGCGLLFQTNCGGKMMLSLRSPLTLTRVSSEMFDKLRTNSIYTQKETTRIFQCIVYACDVITRPEVLPPYMGIITISTIF